MMTSEETLDDQHLKRQSVDATATTTTTGKVIQVDTSKKPFSHPLDSKKKSRFGIVYDEQTEEEVEANQFYTIPNKYDPKPFIPPRWVPDDEVLYCKLCRTDFDWYTRKHHCRHCGNIFCLRCASEKLFLPLGFKYQDPQRVCQNCYAYLLPSQQSLFRHKHLHGHEKINYVDLTDSAYFPTRYCNLPFSITLGAEIRKAAYALHNLYEGSDYAIPLDLLRHAQGLVFLTVLKGGLILGPRIGTGLVVARLPETQGGGWSAPSALLTGGVMAGALVGLDVTDYVIVLTTREAVLSFAQSGQVSVGGELDITLGPVGRAGAADIFASQGAYASAYAYAHTRGLYGGVSLEGTVIVARYEVNQAFYGRYVTPTDLLTGKVPRPRAGTPLYHALHQILEGKEYHPEVDCDQFPPPPPIVLPTAVASAIGAGAQPGVTYVTPYEV